MRKIFFAALTLMSSVCYMSAAETLNSPNGKLAVTFDLTVDGTPTYALTFDGKDVVKPSRLGLELKSGDSMLKGFKLVNTTRDSFDETWTPVWGET